MPTAYSDMHVEFAGSCSMNSFLMALRRSMCALGTPNGFVQTAESSWWLRRNKYKPGTIEGPSGGLEEED